VALRPDSADAHTDLGAALAEAGLKQEAVAELRRALEIDPNHSVARENLRLLGK
jgi:Flp pilus assembly protein TadD